MADACTIGWDVVTNTVTGVATFLLAAAAFWTIRQESARERLRYTPMLTLDFSDQEEHEALGAPGFRHIQSHPRHSALLLSGTLRNLAETAAVDCRLDIYVAKKTNNIVHEIRGIHLHSGLAAADTAAVSELLTLDDVTPKADGLFDVGILGLFSLAVPAGKDYPFAVVLSCKNASGDLFFSAYALHNGSRFDAGHQPHPAPTMVFKGSSRGTFTWGWFRARINA
jgi:hypothetical protein